MNNKVTGISTKEELDTHIQNDYNNQKEVSQDEKRDISSKQTGHRSSMEQDSLSNDRTTTTSNSTEGRESISNREGNLSESNSRVNMGGNTTNSDLSPTQLKLDFKSIEDVADAVGKGEFKHQTVKDVDNLVKELEKFTPYEKTTWKEICESVDNDPLLKEVINRLDPENVLKYSGNPAQLEQLVKRELGTAKLQDVLTQKLLTTTDKTAKRFFRSL